MKIITMSSIVIISLSSLLYATPTSDELVVLHNVTTAEMNAISTPVEGSLIFNTDNKEVYERNATTWRIISNNGSETKIIAGNGISVTGSGTVSDPYQVSIITPSECAPTDQVFSACSAVTPKTDGEYCIDHDGAGESAEYKVYCDMTTDGGGWSRVVRTTGNNQQFGQKDDTIDYAEVTATDGIYKTYDKIKNFSKVMIKKVGTSDYASYDLVSTVSGESIHDIMTFVKNQTMILFFSNK